MHLRYLIQSFYLYWSLTYFTSRHCHFKIRFGCIFTSCQLWWMLLLILFQIWFGSIFTPCLLWWMLPLLLLSNFNLEAFLHHVNWGGCSLYYYQIWLKAFLHHVKLRWMLPFIIIKFDWKHFEVSWSILTPCQFVVDAPFTIISNLNWKHHVNLW